MIKTNAQRSQRGFTLIELIVIIVIIGILLALGIGSWSSSQNRSKKEAAVAVAEKVKLTLGTYFTEKDRYPAAQGTVTSYLTSKGDSATATSFGDTSKFVYTGLTASGGACNETGANKCEKYTITINKSVWQGGSSDSDVVVTP